MLKEGNKQRVLKDEPGWRRFSEQLVHFLLLFIVVFMRNGNDDDS